MELRHRGRRLFDRGDVAFELSRKRLLNDARDPSLVARQLRSRWPSTLLDGCLGPAVFNVLAFLAGLGSAACGFLALHELLLAVSGYAAASLGRLGLAIVQLGLGVILGRVAILLLRRR